MTLVETYNSYRGFIYMISGQERMFLRKEDMIVKKCLNGVLSPPCLHKPDNSPFLQVRYKIENVI